MKRHLVLIVVAVLVLTPIALWLIESVMDSYGLSRARKPFEQKARAEEIARESAMREVDARLAAGNAVSKRAYDKLVDEEQHNRLILQKAFERCEATKIGDAAVLRCVAKETQ
jgi:hypothetical protein